MSDDYGRLTNTVTAVMSSILGFEEHVPMRTTEDPVL